MPESTEQSLPRGKTAQYLRRIGAAADAARGAAFGPSPALRPPRKLYRVSEIADYFGLTRQTVHNYATIGLITEEAQTPGGQRLFDESVFPRLGLIQSLKMTHRLNDIRRILQAHDLAAGSLLPGNRLGPGGLSAGDPAAPTAETNEGSTDSPSETTDEAVTGAPDYKGVRSPDSPATSLGTGSNLPTPTAPTAEGDALP